MNKKKWRRFLGFNPIEAYITPFGDLWDVAWIDTSKHSKAIVKALEEFLEEQGVLAPLASLEAITERSMQNLEMKVPAHHKKIDVGQHLDLARRKGISVLSLHDEGPTYFLSRLLPLFNHYDIPSPCYSWIGGVGNALLTGEGFFAAETTRFIRGVHRNYLRTGSWLQSPSNFHNFEDHFLSRFSLIEKEDTWELKGICI